MLIRGVRARIIKDSRGQKTIEVKVNNGEWASSPNGKSTGDYETKQYYKSLEFCVDFLNNFKDEIEINKFDDLIFVENYISKKLNLKKARHFGGNALYAFESAILKALAKEKGKELFEIIDMEGVIKKIPLPVGNVVGGGLHSSMIEKHPNFQEFVVVPTSNKVSKNYKIMKEMHSRLKKEFKTKKVNDEGALLVSVDDQEVFDILNRHRNKTEKKVKVKIGIGIDAAASEIFRNKKYDYGSKKRSAREQYLYMEDLMKDYDLSYVEDPFEQHDFESFKKLQKKSGRYCMIVGDDLTASQYSRVAEAIKTKSINAIIIKPNQNGSLIELKKLFTICRKHKIKTILSHRSGETLDDALADYSVGFGADYIKCGVATKWREVKLKRLIKIEKKL